MRKSVFAALCAAAVLGLAIPAAAETFTSSNGVLSIELPNENWKEITDMTKWIALSDGGNLITVEHFSNGEKLPEMTVADDHYVDVYQAVFSTQNEVFIITGSVVDAAAIPEVANAIVSAKVLQYDTKLAVKQNSQAAVSASEFTLAPLDKTMYVTTNGLNVRTGCSTNDQILGAIAYGSSVHVTGSVQRGGADIGWYQISYNSGNGFVSAEFLSDKEPAKRDDTKNGSKTFTGNVKTIYSLDGTAITIYEAGDGEWYDNKGGKFTWIGDDRLTNEGGEAFTTTRNASGKLYTGNTMTVYALSGTPVVISEGTDGYWYTESGTRLSWLDSERLESEGGEAFTTYDSTEDDDDDDADDDDDLVYCEYCGQYYEAGEVFRNHVCPERDAAMAAEAEADAADDADDVADDADDYADDYDDED